MKKKSESQYGFTLLELAGVLLVSSVLAGMGVPMVMDMKNGSEGSSLQDEFAMSLTGAREHALSSGVSVSVCASDDGKSCKEGVWSKGWIVYQGKRLHDGEQVSLANLISSRKIENDKFELSVYDENFAAVRDIRFNEQGFNVDQRKFESAVCSSNKNRLPESVSIERSGRVRVLARINNDIESQNFCS